MLELEDPTRALYKTRHNVHSRSLSAGLINLIVISEPPPRPAFSLCVCLCVCQSFLLKFFLFVKLYILKDNTSYVSAASLHAPLV
jgi:hypothetical protein